MTLRRAMGATLLTAWLGLGAGCITVPPDLRADMEPPDGSRPNNFGRLVGEGDDAEIQPDRPTIAAATTATTTAQDTTGAAR